LYKVEIIKLAWYCCYVRVSQEDYPHPLGMDHSDVLYSFFGFAEKKARKFADQTIRQWKRNIKEQEDKITYTVE
jgi:hypothetical protein